MHQTATDAPIGDAPAPPPAPSSAPGRPAEVELWSNRVLIHPASRRLVTALIPTGVTPNMVSVSGVLAAIAAAAAYTLPPWPWAPFAGLACHWAWHVLDGADGDLARRTGTSSTYGELVDGVCDYLGRIILYVALAAFCARQIGGWAWPLAVLVGLSRIVQANDYETLRRSYRRWAYGVGWIRQDLGHAAPADGLAGAAQGLGRLFLWVSARVTPDGAALDQAVATRLARRGPGSARTVCREHLAPAVKRASVLSTNGETLAIFLAMLAGSPLYLFLYVALGLNLAYAALYLDQRAAFARTATALDHDLTP